VDERIDAMIDQKQMLVSTSPRGGDVQQPKKNPNGKPRDQEELSTIKTARANSARAHLRGKVIEDSGGRRSGAKGRSPTPLS
jgi:hypothetical protein